MAQRGPPSTGSLVRQAAEPLIREMDVEDKTKEIVRREAPPEPAEAPARRSGSGRPGYTTRCSRRRATSASE